jgi:hypothetical protein
MSTTMRPPCAGQHTASHHASLTFTGAGILPGATFNVAQFADWFKKRFARGVYDGVALLGSHALLDDQGCVKSAETSGEGLTGSGACLRTPAASHSLGGADAVVQSDSVLRSCRGSALILSASCRRPLQRQEAHVLLECAQDVLQGADDEPPGALPGRPPGLDALPH